MENDAYHIYIYSDSRGLWLRNAIRAYSVDNVIFHVTARKGAGLHLLWTLAEYDLLTRKVDMIIIQCGICDLTDRMYNPRGVREFWPPYDADERFHWVEKTMWDIKHNFTLLNTNATLVFLPEQGADLITYNRQFHPVQSIKLIVQESFMRNVSRLQAATRRINDSLSSPTPRWLEVSHYRRGKEWIPVYSRFYDGLHPTAVMIDHYARIICDYVNWRFNIHGARNL